MLPRAASYCCCELADTFGSLVCVSRSRVLDQFNLVFVGIFSLEATLKICAQPSEYFRSSWNRFDFFIVAGSLIGIALELLASIKIGPILTVVRTFRVGRILRLIKSAKSLNRLFETLLVTLPSLGNVGGILLLLFFIYAVMGVQLFATVQLKASLNAHANFQTFWSALLTLMRASTGESWNAIMYDLVKDAPGCDAVRTSDARCSQLDWVPRRDSLELTPCVVGCAALCCDCRTFCSGRGRSCPRCAASRRRWTASPSTAAERGPRCRTSSHSPSSSRLCS